MCVLCVLMCVCVCSCVCMCLCHTVPADELKGAGDVEHLSVRSIGPIHHILALNSNTGLVVWDLR